MLQRSSHCPKIEYNLIQIARIRTRILRIDTTTRASLTAIAVVSARFSGVGIIIGIAIGTGAATIRIAISKGVLMKSLRAGLLGSLQGPDLITTWRLLHASGEDRTRLMLAVAQG